MIKEIWKPISWTHNRYEVSNTGHIRNIKTKKVLEGVGRDGYKRGTFSVDGKKLWYMDHLEVARAFIGKSNLTVNHIDGDKLNNRVDNLEYVSMGDNNRHRSETMGYRRLRKKLPNKVVRFIKESSLNNQQLANQFSTSRYVIRDIRIGRTYKNI